MVIDAVLAWIAVLVVMATVWYWTWRLYRRFKPKPLPKLPDGWKDATQRER